MTTTTRGLNQTQFLLLLSINVFALVLIHWSQFAHLGHDFRRNVKRSSHDDNVHRRAQANETNTRILKSVTVETNPQTVTASTTQRRRRRTEFGQARHRGHVAPDGSYVPYKQTVQGVTRIQDDSRWQDKHELSVSTTTTAAKSRPRFATTSCEVCVANPDDPMCLEYGLDNIRLSRAYMGSGTRVRKFLEKAIRGDKVKIGVIGGSVSHGHGIWPQRGEESWVERFVRTFRQQFPNTEIENGSMPATASEWFSLCWDSKIDNDADLYLVELEINDVYHEATYKHVDALTRSILGLPQEPALIRIGTVATSFPNMLLGLSAGLVMSNHFDSPYITIRNFMLPHFMSHPDQSSQFFAVLPDGQPDFRHIAKLGHQALADMLTLYLREMTCEVEKRHLFKVPQPSSPWPQNDILGKIPRLHIWEPFSIHKSASPVQSFCSFFGSRRQLEPDSSLTDSCWKRIDWNDKSALVCQQPNKQISFNFVGTRVGLFVYMRNDLNQGKLVCWIDQNVDSWMVIDGFWQQASRPEFFNVGENLEFGQQ
ncbi:hypothetical protein OIO90_003554 [Microbotryomycetes sp. JL221]|nr:hypothetical protein OIO90_003554 [Microbotryomycetes sp. JL221]